MTRSLFREAAWRSYGKWVATNESTKTNFFSLFVGSETSGARDMRRNMSGYVDVYKTQRMGKDVRNEVKFGNMALQIGGVGERLYQ